MTNGVSTYMATMVTSVITQVLPTLRSTCFSGDSRLADFQEPTAPSEGDLETELLRGCVPRRDRDAPQLKGIAARHVEAAERRAAATESGRFHEIPAAVVEVLASPVWIRKQVNGGGQLVLKIEAGAQDFLFRHRLTDGPEIDVR